MGLPVQNLDSCPIGPFCCLPLCWERNPWPLASTFAILFTQSSLFPPAPFLAWLNCLPKLSFWEATLDSPGCERYFSGLPWHSALSPGIAVPLGSSADFSFSPIMLEAVWSPLQNQLLAKTLKTSWVKRTECPLDAFLRV